MTASELDSELVKSGYFQHIGFQLVEWHEGHAVLELEINEKHLNRARVVHGGILTSLIDISGGFAGCYCTTQGNIRKAVTLSLTTSFTGQATRGTIRATARTRVIGRQIYFASAEVYCESGKLLAFGEATYRYRRGSENPAGVLPT